MDLTNLDTILELNDEHKRLGEIYVITNNINNKQYIGQTLTHRKNKKKYRPFGYIGRFNDHISEATNNTKQKQCSYLNNAIRKYGKSNFTVVLIQRCNVDVLDELEIKFIKKKHTLYPSGYNLTKGGKCGSFVSVKKENHLNKKRTKRGRDFGYKHKLSTIQKMSKRLKQICNNPKIKNRMRKTMQTYYDNKKIEILSEYNIDDDMKKYIKPVRSKNTGEIHDYIIRINGRKLTLRSTNYSLEEKYQKLEQLILQAKKLRISKNC